MLTGKCSPSVNLENIPKWPCLHRILSVVPVKMAHYASSSAQNFWKLCGNYASFSKLCFLPSKLCYLVFKQNEERTG